ncbi:hypothetical protein IFM89_016311 [Coptis chinensis]|uniref:Uncharacterized protein n=1 Tax=Coptis chinensis TaxID=261450 RepID=A0A835H5U9_9MAGN|nr:hypothetical protein IFM89_016311 [Coptis chinensis]
MMNSLSSFPPTQTDYNSNRTTTTISSSSQSSNNPQNTSPALMRLILKDDMLRLHNNSVLSQTLKVKYPEIVNLQNITVFALDDASIFYGGHAYLSNFRFHIVPNKMMLSSDLMRLPTGSTLPTLDPGQTAVEFGSNRATTSFDSPAAIGDLAIFKAKEVGVMDSCAADKRKGCRVAPVPPNRNKDLL